MMMTERKIVFHDNCRENRFVEKSLNCATNAFINFTNYFLFLTYNSGLVRYTLTLVTHMQETENERERKRRIGEVC